MACCNFGLRDVAAVKERLAKAAAQGQPGEWLQGWGWDDNQWDVRPSAALLDQIVPHRPVILHRLDMHTVWVNSAALQAANISAATADPAAYQDLIPNAGGLFLGERSFEVLGDYVAGPSHVMPTSGTARFSSSEPGFPAGELDLQRLSTLDGLVCTE